MPKRYTRKQLKKPDDFITLSMKVWGYVREQFPVVLTAAGAVAAVVAGIWTWSYFSDRRGLAATELLTRGIEIKQQMTVPAAQAAPPEDNIPRFATREAKLKAADEEFSKVVSKGGRLATEAYAFRASVRFDAGRYQEAIEDYKKLLAETDDDLVKARTLENLGYCHEGLKQWDQALDSFRKIPRTGDLKYVGTYHEARILAKRGKAKEAAKLFQEVIARGGPAIQDRASDQLALLEGK